MAAGEVEQRVPIQSQLPELHHCPCCGVPYISFHKHSIPAKVDVMGGIWPSKDEDGAGAGILNGFLKRVFIPCKDTEWKGASNPDTLIRYNSKSQFSNYLISRTPSGLLFPRLSTLVVVVDGACRGNGTESAQAGIGVFFGPGSCYNRSNSLPREFFRQTNNVAEIIASWLALHLIASKILAHSTPKIQQVVVVTDSEYLVKAMTQDIWGWLKNGFMTCKRKKVKNAEFLLELHKVIESFRKEMAVDVRFWRVDRRFTEKADNFANIALDGGQPLDVKLDVCLQCVDSVPVPETCPHV